MSRIHDMGGRFGDDPARPDPQGIPQLGDWQARALALTLAAGGLGQWNIDMSRRAREQLCPRDYMAFSYFEKWLAGLADLLVETGVPMGLAIASVHERRDGFRKLLGRPDLREQIDQAKKRLRRETSSGV